MIPNWAIVYAKFGCCNILLENAIFIGKASQYNLGKRLLHFVLHEEPWNDPSNTNLAAGSFAWSTPIDHRRPDTDLDAMLW